MMEQEQEQELELELELACTPLLTDEHMEPMLLKFFKETPSGQWAPAPVEVPANVGDVLMCWIPAVEEGGFCLVTFTSVDLPWLMNAWYNIERLFDVHSTSENSSG